MDKTEYIYMISDNVRVYNITLPPDYEGQNLFDHLNKFSAENLVIIAGFNKNFLEHFLIVSKGKNENDLKELLKKLEKVSYMIGPTGNLSYLGYDQIEYVLTKIDALKLNDINEAKISIIADEQLQEQFGGSQDQVSIAFENQLESATFYLREMGYTPTDIKEKLDEVRQDPKKLDSLFNLPPKEIQSLPIELQHGAQSEGGQSSDSQDVTIDRSPDLQGAIDGYIQQIQQDHPPERAQKVAEILSDIKDYAKEHMTPQYESVLRQMHPSRLGRALKMLKDTKRKSKRLPLILEWYFCSHLIESIEFKVEHWQVSAGAGHGQTGVYTAGISFSRYDPVIKDFDDPKLAKVVNIMRRILATPSKRAIQKLGQDLVAETGFDEHLYFTD